MKIYWLPLNMLQRLNGKYLNSWIYLSLAGEKMSGTVTVNKEAIIDLIRMKEEFDLIVESLELMSDKEFMESYNKAKEQVKKKDFADWNEL